MSTTIRGEAEIELFTDLYRMTVDEYERLVAAGALDDPKIELLDGYLVRKMGKKPRHSTRSERLRRLLERGLPLPGGWHVRQEQPVKIPEYNEPEPDLAIARGEVEDYEDRHPDPGDVALIVEVADSSLARDQGRKWVAYARGGIPVYWIVNLVDHQVEVYSDPSPDGYLSSQALKPGQDVPVVIEGTLVGRIAVADVLP
ncbi:MAG: Uma2 family endonuclease [Isosphaerales bacterium]